MPLASLEQLKTRLGIAADVSSEDSILTQILNGATAMIERECNREGIIYAAADRTEVYDGDCGTILLRCWPVTSVVSVKEDYDRDFAGAAALVANDDFYVSAARGRLVRLAEGTRWAIGSDTVQVVYRGGYLTPGSTPVAGVSEPPQNLTEACIQLAHYFYKRKDSIGLGGANAGQGAISGVTDREVRASVTGLLAGESRL